MIGQNARRLSLALLSSFLISERMPSENAVEICTSTKQENISSTPCAICRRQFSKYTCPTCNVPYCSLTCFRSQDHAECSEAFYRKEIEADVKATPKSKEEKQKMIELLRRFEEDTLDDPLDDEDARDLADRLENLDIDSASYDDLWAALTPAERDKFLAALRNPTSELAQQLLTSEKLENDRVAPWWDNEDYISIEDTPESSTSSRDIHQARFGHRPEAMDLPQQLQTSQIRNPLLYNTVALLIGYSYATRSLSISPLSSLAPHSSEYDESRGIISRIAPFLVDSKSKTIFPSLSACITDIWSRFEEGSLNPRLLSILLQDVSKLLRPSPVTVLSDNPSLHSSHPNYTALLALSDIASIFQPSNPKGNHITHKLKFYAAKILATPTVVVAMLSEEVMTRAKRAEKEGLKVQPSERAMARPTSSDAPRVEEILPS
ncbi:hypothetical protein NLI96_g6878 [Meripilus lineatus]|uniref:HIT-type domain-containing protein n=1 Tax=Meripilus lineatus TaxID=2056292 RepID=A0AAD5YHR6_9APHY|nr:hypothetical protein NLI96_g6878 [Physisporinus lineatus]